ncbi:MAG: Glycosyl transferase family 2 [Candidatus Curtissbacteria bacterium GW2011_GWA1_41_11]|uniref:Glycosyl transferase family 2 n=1 Tax=Candidatus Curtissbacteria bacterium GW2011_GWA1_41_11 TaxID=1618409 RepID=A0A0G0UKW5_9BACT|nr:MAG: Glycosyl transferase family 2 [Candidatus Curtissbacteria bacterium GW2011_GWA1_41_11]
MKKTISIVIPIYNEEENIQPLYKELSKLIKLEKKYNFEIITVEHGSKDNTFETLLKIRAKDKQLKILQLSKNFGNADAAIEAGLQYSSGDAAVIIMADLEEPPELISKFLRKWEQGYEIVYGIVKQRSKNVALSRKFASVVYYKLLNSLTGNIFPENVSDFRLIDKKVYKTINKMEEKNKYLRGLIAWSGFNQTGIPFKRTKRYSGESKAKFLAVLKVALNGIFSFSYVPLKIVTIMGFILSIISFLFIIYQLILFLIFGRGQPGISTIVVLISFLFGMSFIIWGIIGEYLSRIYDEVKNRPNFIVKQKIGFK